MENIFKKERVFEVSLSSKFFRSFELSFTLNFAFGFKMDLNSCQKPKNTKTAFYPFLFKDKRSRTSDWFYLSSAETFKERKPILFLYYSRNPGQVSSFSKCSFVDSHYFFWDIKYWRFCSLINSETIPLKFFLAKWNQ